MGNLLIFRVVLDPPQLEYRVGQVVRGYVHIHLIKPMPIGNIAVYVQGQGGSDTNTFHNGIFTPGAYRYEEIYMSEKFTVFGKEGDEDDVTEHQSGEFRYPFTCALRNTCMPSSFEGKYGCVRYFCKAVLKRPGKSHVLTYSPFTFTRGLSLDNDITAQHPVHVRRPMGVGRCGIEIGKLAYSLSLNKKGFLPGEDIVIHAQAVNKTTFPFKGSTIELIQIQEFLNGSRYENARSHKVLIKRFHQHKVAPGDEDMWAGERITVPQVTESYLYGCYSIEVSYIIKFRAGPGAYPYITTPIIIGTRSGPDGIFATELSGQTPVPPGYLNNGIAVGMTDLPDATRGTLTNPLSRNHSRSSSFQDGSSRTVRNHVTGVPRRLAGFPHPARPRYVGDEVYDTAPDGYTRVESPRHKADRRVSFTTAPGRL